MRVYGISKFIVGAFAGASGFNPGLFCKPNVPDPNCSGQMVVSQTVKSIGAVLQNPSR